MIKIAFNRLAWGFLFIMIDFRLQGFDILPDVIGYILFAIGISALSANSLFFKKAVGLNVVMIIVSIFEIWQRPAQEGGISFSPFGLLVGIISLIVSLFIVYYLFMGIKEMAKNQEKVHIFDEAGRRWTQFLTLQLAALFSFILIFIPPLAIILFIGLFIAAIIITFLIMGFLRRCGEALDGQSV